MRIEPFTDANREDALALLRRRRPSSLFLLGNLADQGPVLTDHLNSGDYRVLRRDDGAVGAVFAHYRRGNLIVQTDRFADYAAAIVADVRSDGRPLQGILGDFEVVAPCMAALAPRWVPSSVKREPLFDLDLTLAVAAPVPEGLSPRRLTHDDFGAWRALMQASGIEGGIPEQGTDAQIAQGFADRVARGVHWGADYQGQLVSIAVLNVIADRMGLVGGVYTVPALRRRGFSRAVMDRMACDSQGALDALVLFTHEDNLAAQQLYRKMGFGEIGLFAMVFGADAG